MQTFGKPAFGEPYKVFEKDWRENRSFRITPPIFQIGNTCNEDLVFVSALSAKYVPEMRVDVNR